jgi:hypothetical protein
MHPHKSMALGTMPEEDHMRTTTIRYGLSLVGMGLMLVGLFGGPAASAADMEPFDYQNDWVAQYPWGQQDYRSQRDAWGRDPWGYRHDGPPRAGLGYGLPDRYTIQKGKKCELQCERIRGSREYTCREYRC